MGCSLGAMASSGNLRTPDATSKHEFVHTVQSTRTEEIQAPQQQQNRQRSMQRRSPFRPCFSCTTPLMHNSPLHTHAHRCAILDSCLPSLSPALPASVDYSLDFQWKHISTYAFMEGTLTYLQYTTPAASFLRPYSIIIYMTRLAILHTLLLFPSCTCIFAFFPHRESTYARLYPCKTSITAHIRQQIARGFTTICREQISSVRETDIWPSLPSLRLRRAGNTGVCLPVGGSLSGKFRVGMIIMIMNA